MRFIPSSVTAGISLLALVAAGLAQTQLEMASKTWAATGRGAQTFISHCAGCHGLDGRGAERAPNLTTEEVRRLSGKEIVHIVRNGISGTGMPAFHSLTEKDVKAVVRYVRKLQGESASMTLPPGNPVRGRSLFFGKAMCSTCHMVQGEGGFIASDLSEYGGSHSAHEIRRAMESPSSDPQIGARPATVITRSGQKYSGMIRNEDNFSIQLELLDGTFRIFNRSDVENVEYASQPLMPTNYGSILTRRDVEDIASYLMAAAKGKTGRVNRAQNTR
jgi:putative heme-binding domain-containing protein